MKKIICTINGDGEVTMEGVGFKGTACDKAMSELEKSLGIQMKRVNKPEYSAQTSTTAKQTAGGGQ